jgi:hypothetical protein
VGVRAVTEPGVSDMLSPQQQTHFTTFGFVRLPQLLYAPEIAVRPDLARQ